ncbi:hypothetical protein [Aureitalea marina]|uniref:Uncharacterized protein n=1 Tax=Aureitalea marina TaxID=930804 RepID=A0A2S7KQX7_9FLAO|nr:hypothetical protein [Aureitalea marina]PQB05020.1 hypothetical protein BST85_09040 [Aureitalea marina]
MKSTFTRPTYAWLFSIFSLLIVGQMNAQIALSTLTNPLVNSPDTDPIENTIIQIGGETQLIDGKAVIQVDPQWAKTYSEVDYNYQIMIMPDGDCEGIYISNKTTDSFTVREIGLGKSNLKFSWNLVATLKPTEGGPTITKLRDAGPRIDGFLQNSYPRDLDKSIQ